MSQILVILPNKFIFPITFDLHTRFSIRKQIRNQRKKQQKLIYLNICETVYLKKVLVSLGVSK